MADFTPRRGRLCPLGQRDSLFINRIGWSTHPAMKAPTAHASLRRPACIRGARCVMLSPSGAGWSRLAARRAHNPKVGGSNPPPATKHGRRPGTCAGLFISVPGSRPIEGPMPRPPRSVACSGPLGARARHDAPIPKGSGFQLRMPPPMCARRPLQSTFHHRPQPLYPPTSSPAASAPNPAPSPPRSRLPSPPAPQLLHGLPSSTWLRARRFPTPGHEPRVPRSGQVDP